MTTDEGEIVVVCCTKILLLLLEFQWMMPRCDELKFH